MTETKLQPEYPDLDKFEYNNGDIYYYKKDTTIKHNPYGPAIIHINGTKSYYINNKRHRLDGPAIIRSDGDVEYWINYLYMGSSKEEFYNDLKNLKTKNINNQDKINILNIKNSLSHNLDSSSLNILKYLL